MPTQAPFADWRVLELSNGIAASYCGKMFADAGADVVKIESPQGDSIRGWSACTDGPAGALFGYLAAGKRSVVNHQQAEIAARHLSATPGFGSDELWTYEAGAKLRPACIPYM